MCSQDDANQIFLSTEVLKLPGDFWTENYSSKWSEISFSKGWKHESKAVSISDSFRRMLRCFIHLDQIEKCGATELFPMAPAPTIKSKRMAQVHFSSTSHECISQCWALSVLSDRSRESALSVHSNLFVNKPLMPWVQCVTALRHKSASGQCYAEISSGPSLFANPELKLHWSCCSTEENEFKII